jgi:imidazolonepropionase-like amidohydrolase
MAVQMDMANFTADPSLLDSPLLHELESKSAIDSFRHKRSFCKTAVFTLQWQRDDKSNDIASFGKLHAASVPMLAGSDTNNMGTIQGFSLHREIKIMQDCGYTPWEALASATTRASQFLHRPSGFKPGEEAELLILDADPTVSIANTQKIFGVVHHGNLIDRPSILPSK